MEVPDSVTLAVYTNFLMPGIALLGLVQVVLLASEAHTGVTSTPADGVTIPSVTSLMCVSPLYIPITGVEVGNEPIAAPEQSP